MRNTNPDTLIDNFLTQIINPTILLMFVVSVLVFSWGLFQMIRNSDNDTEIEKGKRIMIYGIIGFFIMLSAKVILDIIKNTFGM